MSTFTPTKQSNPCLVCGDNEGKCRQTETDLALCMTLEQQAGFKSLGLTKNGTWTKFVPNNGETSQEQREQKRRDWQAKREQRAEAEAQRRAEAMPAAERDRHYRRLLSQLSLHPADQAELVRRGYSAEQIKDAGYKSVEQWQRLEFELPHTLPGVSLDGRSLNTPAPGYLCPITDLDGLIVGCQIRVRSPGEDEGKYLWLSSNTKKRSNGPTPNTKETGELPLAVYSNGPMVALAEGVGAKPSLAAIRTGYTVIGAAGGQWAYLPETFKATVEKLAKAGDTITLFTDAGDRAKSGPMRRWKATTELLQSWGYLVQVWEGSADIDEVPLAELERLEFITPAEFFPAPKVEAGHDGEITKADWLKLKAEKLPTDEETFEFRKWYKKRNAGFFELAAADAELNQRWLNSDEAESIDYIKPSQLTLIKSATGSNKTGAVNGCITKIREAYPDARIYGIAHRQTLGRGGAERLQRETGEGRFLNDLVVVSHGQGHLSPALRYHNRTTTLVVDSVSKIIPDVIEDAKQGIPTFVVIDELEAVTRHWLFSSTIGGKRQAILRDIEQLLQATFSSGGGAVAMDAYLTQLSIEYLKDIIGAPVPVKVYRNNHKGHTHPIVFHKPLLADEFGNVRIDDETGQPMQVSDRALKHEAFELAAKFVRAGEIVAIPSDSQAFVETLEEGLREALTGLTVANRSPNSLALDVSGAGAKIRLLHYISQHFPTLASVTAGRQKLYIKADKKWKLAIVQRWLESTYPDSIAKTKLGNRTLQVWGAGKGKQRQATLADLQTATNQRFDVSLNWEGLTATLTGSSEHLDQIEQFCRDRFFDASTFRVDRKTGSDNLVRLVISDPSTEIPKLAPSAMAWSPIMGEGVDISCEYFTKQILLGTHLPPTRQLQTIKRLRKPVETHIFAAKNGTRGGDDELLFWQDIYKAELARLGRSVEAADSLNGANDFAKAMVNSTVAGQGRFDMHLRYWAKYKAADRFMSQRLRDELLVKLQADGWDVTIDEHLSYVPVAPEDEFELPKPLELAKVTIQDRESKWRAGLKRDAMPLELARKVMEQDGIPYEKFTQAEQVVLNHAYPHLGQLEETDDGGLRVNSEKQNLWDSPDFQLEYKVKSERKLRNAKDYFYLCNPDAAIWADRISLASQLGQGDIWVTEVSSHTAKISLYQRLDPERLYGAELVPGCELEKQMHEALWAEHEAIRDLTGLKITKPIWQQEADGDEPTGKKNQSSIRQILKFANRIGIGHQAKREGTGERVWTYQLQSKDEVMGSEIGAICLSLKAKFIADVHEISNRAKLRNLMDARYRPLAGSQIQIEGCFYRVVFVGGNVAYLEPADQSIREVSDLTLCWQVSLEEFEALIPCLDRQEKSAS